MGQEIESYISSDSIRSFLSDLFENLSVQNTFYNLNELAESDVICFVEVNKDFNENLLLNTSQVLVCNTKSFNILKSYQFRKDHNILGIINIDWPMDLALPVMKVISEKNNIDLDKLYLKLSKTKEDLVSTLSKVEALHHKVVRPRTFSANNFKILAKFSAGISNGGDFFDINTKKNSTCIFLCSSSSYILNSTIITQYDQFKKSSKSFDDFYNELYKEINEIEFEGNKSCSIFYGELTENLKLTIHNYGNFQVYCSNSSMRETKEFHEMKLSPNEKVLIASPGMAQLSNAAKLNVQASKLINDSNLTSKQIFDEIHYELKKDIETNFLDSDVTTLIIEVNEKTITEV